MDNIHELWEIKIPYNDKENDFVPKITAYHAGSKGAVIVFAHNSSYLSPCICCTSEIINNRVGWCTFNN